MVQVKYSEHFRTKILSIPVHSSLLISRQNESYLYFYDVLFMSE